VCLSPAEPRRRRRLAAVTGEPEIRRATAREANELIGFTIGGIPPIGFERAVRVVMDPDLGRYRRSGRRPACPTAVFEVPPATPADARQRDGRTDQRGAPCARDVEAEVASTGA
jgi:hypothetical protein